MKHIRHHHDGYRYTDKPVRGQLGDRDRDQPQPRIFRRQTDPDLPADPASRVDGNLLDELQSLLSRLGAVKISMTLYLVEFGNLPDSAALPLLQQAAGPCALLRVPAQGQHLVIFLGPEPSPDTGGFPDQLERALNARMPAIMAPCALTPFTWARIKMLRRCNHDVAEPAYLLQDLNAAVPRTIGTTGK